MANDPILNLLGLARKAGRLEVGEEPVGASCRARQARLILLADDAAANTRRRAAHFGEAGNILFLDLPFTKEELGYLFGRSSCAMLAITDSGFSATIVEKLAARYPERYDPAAQQLRVKADRVLQRQKEQRQHEKNLRDGKYKPWAYPSSPSPKKGAGAHPSKPKGKPTSKPPSEDASTDRTKDGSARPGQSQPPKSKPPGQGASTDRTKGGSARPGQSQNPKSKPPGQGASTDRAKGGSARPGHAPKPGPGGRRLSGKFRHNP